jgi:hypothetical protein
MSLQKKKAGEDQMRSIEELTKKLQAKDIQVFFIFPRIR